MRLDVEEFERMLRRKKSKKYELEEAGWEITICRGIINFEKRNVFVSFNINTGFYMDTNRSERVTINELKEIINFVEVYSKI